VAEREEISRGVALGEPATVIAGRLCRSTATSFNAATSSSLCPEPRCSIRREPRREDHTTWTALAPEDVRTVRTYATAAGYEHG
jgi:hypothetical protein